MSDQPPPQDRPDQVPPPDVDPAAVTPDHDDEIRAAAERDSAAASVRPDISATDRLVAAITGTSVRVTALAFLSAMILGAVIIAFSEEAVRDSLGYFFSRPTDTLSAAWEAGTEAYAALFRGALGGVSQLSETGVAAIPLILTGLAVAVPLRAGMFNIGGEGQVIAGGLVAGLVGFSFQGLPLIIHLPLAIGAGFLGGALMGFIPGFLKARTGAHEVISTIMLNNIAIFVTEYLLTTELYRQPGRSDPISKSMLDSATLPRLLGSGNRLHAGLFLALLAAGVVWWFLERSTYGFEITAVGLNPYAATAAGMSVTRMVVLGMTMAGALAGLAGTAQVLGVQGRLTGGFSSGLGFDGITVALLGRGTVGGTVAAGVLFGALKAGGRAMQATTGTSLDLVVVIQALVILFVAAPALVRAIYRIKAEDTATGQVAQGWGS